MIAARVVQGAGGGVLPLSFGIIRDEFGARMNGALSVLASLTAVGFGVGIVVAGPIVDGLGYAWLFLLPMCATLVAAVAAFLVVPDSPVRTPARLPVPAGRSCWPLFLVALLLGLSWGNEHGWLSARVLGLFTLAAVTGWAWVSTELRVPVPMIDMHLMRRRGMWTANVVAGAMGFATFAAFAFIPQLLQTPPEAGYGFGASITESGYLLASLGGGQLRGRVRHGPADLVGGRAGRDRHRPDARRCLVPVHRVLPRRDLAAVRRDDRAGRRRGPGLLQPRRRGGRGGPGRADRGRQRHERQHPHHRRLARRGGDGRHRHRPRRLRAASRSSAATPSASRSWAS